MSQGKSRNLERGGAKTEKLSKNFEEGTKQKLLIAYQKLKTNYPKREHGRPLVPPLDLPLMS